MKKIAHSGNYSQSMSYFYTYVGCTRIWRDSDALCFEGEHCFPVLLREPLYMDSFLHEAEVVCTPGSFVGKETLLSLEMAFSRKSNRWADSL